MDDISILSQNGVQTGSMGASVFGRIIPYIRLAGKSEHAVLVTAGIHAREHVSCLAAMRQVYALAQRELPCTLYVVPMLNPDGNVLVESGADAFGFYKSRLLKENGSADFSLWKANAAGVDLNVNFDARWGTGVQNVRTAGAQNYIGEKPESEPETQALVAFTRKVRPSLTLSYHAKGQEIYYDFYQTGKERARDEAIAAYAASLTGYTLINGTRGSAGGYKDWCIQELEIPALTVEWVSDSYAHPLPDESIEKDVARAIDLPVRLYEFMQKNNYV